MGVDGTLVAPAAEGERSGGGRLPLRNAGWPGAVLVAGVCLLAGLVASAVLTHETGPPSGDAPYYERIASHPAGPHNFPYAFRIGVPYLVHALPFSQSFSWAAIALLCIGIAGGAMFALLREFHVGAPLAGALSTLFALSPPLLVAILRNGVMIDPAAVCVITLGCLFIVRRARVALAMTLLAATTIHESCLFLIPLTYAVWARRPFDREALRDTALVSVVSICLYVYLRESIAAVGQSYQPGYTGPFLQARIDVMRDALQHGGWAREVRRLALDFGPLWLAAPLALWTLPFARRGLVFVALCAAGMTFALDWGRVLFFAAPLFYVAAAHVLRRRGRVALAAVLALLALDLGYAAYMQVHGVRHGLDTHAAPARGPVV